MLFIPFGKGMEEPRENEVDQYYNLEQKLADEILILSRDDYMIQSVSHS